MTTSFARWFACLVLCLGLAALARPARADDLVDNAKARATAAGEAYEAAWRNMEGNVLLVPTSAMLDELHLWSRRLMEAGQDVSDKKEDKVAAAQADVERMKKVEAFVNKRHDEHYATADSVAAAKFYRLDAERQVLLAKAK
jgi:hypothetical protein